MGVLRGIDRRDTFPGRVKSVRSDGERVLLFGPAITTPLQEVCSIRGKPSPPGGGSAFCLGRSLGYNDHRRFAHFPGTMEGGALPGTHRLPPFWPRTGTFCDRRHKYFHELSGMVETAAILHGGDWRRIMPVSTQTPWCCGVSSDRWRPRRAGCENNWGCRRSVVRRNGGGFERDGLPSCVWQRQALGDSATCLK